MFSVPVIQKVYDPTAYDQLCGGGCLGKIMFLNWEKKKMMLCSRLICIFKNVAVAFAAFIESLSKISEDNVGYI